MLPLRYARGWKAASILLLLSVLVATTVPAIWVWSGGENLDSWLVPPDKWLHGLTFVVLALWFAGQYRPRAYWRIGLGLLAFGGLIEVIQNFIDYRSGEWMDLAANVFGICVGLALALLGIGGWCLRFEDRFVPVKAGSGDV